MKDLRKQNPGFLTRTTGRNFDETECVLAGQQEALWTRI